MLPRERQTVAPPHGVWLLIICATSLCAANSGAISRLLNIRPTCICFSSSSNFFVPRYRLGVPGPSQLLDYWLQCVFTRHYGQREMSRFSQLFWCFN